MAAIKTESAVTTGKLNITSQAGYTLDIQADIENLPSTCSKVAADVNSDAEFVADDEDLVSVQMPAVETAGETPIATVSVVTLSAILP